MPHGLVHLAGLFEPDPFDPGVQDVWDRAIQVNLKSAYDIAVAYDRRRKKGEAGRMVFTTSIAAGRGSPDYTAYSVAKAGLHGLVRSLAKKFAPDVNVNAVATGSSGNAGIQQPMRRCSGALVSPKRLRMPSRSCAATAPVSSTARSFRSMAASSFADLMAGADG